MTTVPRNQGEAAASILPAQDGRDIGLVFTVAVLSFLACVAVIAALAADRAAQGWARQLSSSATIQVRPMGGETGAEAAARAAEAVAGVKGVAEARAMDRKSSEALLEPWLGKGNIPADLPLPQLVTVELSPDHPATAADLNRALASAHLNATVDDHSRWMADVRSSSDAVRLSATVACLLIATAAASVVAFATRQGLAARRDVVEVLHLCGAEDSFVARLFQMRFAGLATRASAYGALAAATVGAILRSTGGSDGFSPALPIAWTDLLACLAAPALGAIVAAVSARSVAMAILREQV
jgi:cell division transport system permease protein